MENSILDSAQTESNVEKERKFLQNILCCIEQDKSLNITQINITPGCNVGDGYMSQVTRVFLHGTKNEGTEDKDWSVIIKRQPTSQTVRELLRTHVAFRNEVAAYSKVIKAFRNFFGPVIDELKFPKCLYVDNDVIVLEDLKASGFIMSERQKGLDLLQCTLVLQELGRFHSLSLAMKLLDPESFKAVRNSIEEVIYSNEAMSVFGPSVENAVRMAVGGLNVMSHEEDSHLVSKGIETLESYKGTIFEKIQHFVSPKEPFSVLSHGDLTINNLLFKTKTDVNGDLQLEDIRILDLQVMRYSSPAVDLLHFLYTSTLRELRQKYFHELLTIYYTSLQDSLKTLLAGSAYENDIVMTFDDLKEEMNNYNLYGLLNGLWMMTAITADCNNAPDMDKVKLEDFSSDSGLEFWVESQTESYRSRIKDLVIEYVQNGVL